VRIPCFTEQPYASASSVTVVAAVVDDGRPAASTSMHLLPSAAAAFETSQAGSTRPIVQPPAAVIAKGFASGC
jgi:hypothetical protein